MKGRRAQDEIAVATAHAKSIGSVSVCVLVSVARQRDDRVHEPLSGDETPPVPRTGTGVSGGPAGPEQLRSRPMTSSPAPVRLTMAHQIVA